MDKKIEKFKIALVGSSQLSFPGDKAQRFARSAQEMGEFAQLFDFDLYVYPDTVITVEDAEKAIRAVESQSADFLLWQTTSYSSGHLTPILASADVMGLGLWGIPEGADSGVMPLNSFCSINMYSGIISNYVDAGKRFKWFFGDKGSPFLDERLEISVKALRCIKKMRNSKLALIGGVAPGFNDLLFDEHKLLNIFKGMKLNRLHEFAELRDRALAFPASEVRAVANDMAAQARKVLPQAAEKLELNARFYKAYKDFVSENRYDALAISCWPAFGNQFDFSPCALLAQLNEEGTVAACEGDLVSAVCMLMLQYLANESVALMDLVCFDEEDETVLMWHCGPAAKQFCRHYDLELNYSSRPHKYGMDNPNGNGVVRDMVFKPGRATVARFDAGLDSLLICDGSFIDRDKPSHMGSRGWIGDLRLNAEPVSVRDLVNTLLVRRFPHHYPVVMGDFTAELAEISAWLGLGNMLKVSYAGYLQNP